MNGRQTRHGELARVSPRVARVNVLLGVKSRPDVHVFRVDAEHIGNNLRRRCLMALSLRHGPHAQDKFTVDVQLDVGRLGLA